ncbi:MAG: hypothetical protein RJA44_245, partial [Pseudomonadota bacterium]
MSKSVLRRLSGWRATAPALLASAALLSACAQLPGEGAAAPEAAASGASAAKAASAPVSAAAASGPARPAASGAAAPAGPGQPPAFATVIKDAVKVESIFTAWKKDDKVWIELSDKDLGRPLFLSPKLVSGIGEQGFYGGMMVRGGGDFGRPQRVEFRRVHNQIQLIAPNSAYLAKPGTPEARAVQAAFSPSLIASTPVASQPHPERKTFLIEAGTLFSGDLLGLGQLLQRSYRQGYSLDARHSTLLQLRGKPDELIFEQQYHYATSSISAPSSGGALPGAGHGGSGPSTPDTLPDARSLFIDVQYSLLRLPETPMTPRLADQRLGHFTTTVSDFSDDLARSPKRRYIARWRLERKEPQAPLSEPVRPITYWIDRNVPLKYRDAIRAGILEWNKAFEKIGFKDAIQVRQQPDDADFSTLDAGLPSVRWMTNASASFGAVGPIHLDPRSGEILDADIALESLSSRALRTVRSQLIGSNSRQDWAALLQSGDLAAPANAAAHAHLDGSDCQHAELAAEQLGYGLDVLEARGVLDPDSPEVERFVQAYLKDTVMHEVGHTLGLRHNFRASRVHAEAQISDPEFTRSNAFSGSVMEYLPINLPLPGQPAPQPFQTTLGLYDYWAIEYAYRPLEPQQEAAELAQIAARSGEPELAYGTDEDQLLGIDPEVLQFDLGDDPLAYAAKRLEIARDLLQRLERQPLQAGQDYLLLRRSVSYALRDVARVGGQLARQIGGVRTLRDHANTGRDPLLPLRAAQQRAALDLIAGQLLSADRLLISPELQRRLAPDYLERTDAFTGGDGNIATDYAPAQVLAELQRNLLAQLMSDGVAARLLDSEAKSSTEADSLRLAELYQRLGAEVWSELAASRGDIGPLRRELQREHLGRLLQQLLRPGSAGRADARSLVRLQAQELLPRLQNASRRSGLSEVARAHLLDCIEQLREAL